jgi:hypothetical protein
MDSYTTLVKCSSSLSLDVVYLHSAAQAEDTVVGFLGLEALEGGLHNVVLLGEQVIGPVKQSTLARSATVPNICHYFFSQFRHPMRRVRGLRTSIRAACILRRCSTSWRAASSTSGAMGAC